MKNRIWELDALRGLCILGMLAVHLLYDLSGLYGLEYGPVFAFFQNWGGVAFVLLSGICATLGSRSLRRGLVVFGCGMVCTLVTAGMYLLTLAGDGIVIRFGVLHCLGLCMILYPPLKKLPAWALGILGVILAVLGFAIQDVRVETPYLFPLGLVTRQFQSADYFPLLPFFGFFLLGAALGKLLYRDKVTLFPKINANALPIRFLTGCGKASLPIYLLHQPALMLLIYLLQ